MDSQDLLTVGAILMFGLSFTAFWLGVFWFGRMVARLEATADRIEAGAGLADGVRDKQTETLDRMEAATFVVADGRTHIAEDLAGSVSRADATVGQPGEAADAALRTGDTAEAITRRQDDAR